MRRFALFLAAVSFLQHSSQARADFVVNWAASASAGASNATLAPDGQTTSLGPQFPTFTTSNFQATKRYSNLEGLLGISVATLASADVIAWELNGSSAPLGGGWEAARFTVADDQHSVTFDHFEGSLRPGVVGTGSINGGDYDAFFGHPSGTSGNVVSWILLDSPDGFIDFHSPFLTIDLTSGNSLGFSGEGTPDVDAIGIISLSSVPEPTSIAMVGMAGCFIGIRVWQQRRRKPRANPT